MLTRPGTTRRALAGIGLALLLVLGATLPATAARRADPGAGCPPDQPDCSVWDDEPGNPGGPGGGDDGGGEDGGGGGGGVCQWNGRTIPCYDEDLGWFNNGDGCYYKLTEGPTEPPEGEQWYLQTCNGGDLGAQDVVTLADPPAGFGAPPNPEELARRALASIKLLPAPLRVAPRKSIGPGLVGLPVWMWAAPSTSYFGPLTASASDRDVTVSIEAKVREIVWDMGNQEQVACDGPGTPYDPKGDRAGGTSPDCGYDKGYQKADTYQVTATTYWTVTWSGGGESGVIPVTRNSGTVPIQINELQVVTR
ncbi:hypothetical protein KBX26_07890 [Micromonospora sp. C97]|uniref:hypothetical protein n=1 Tax=Micromonospora sp. C97 TaxID=2824883 RepID=UPI001B35D80C|nr:hypothetical protein [Micromonospora sp. C97]MBQ1029926.1 hypothetical protein [Micromonospora sp. C97]